MFWKASAKEESLHVLTKDDNPLDLWGEALVSAFGDAGVHDLAESIASDMEQFLYAHIKHIKSAWLYFDARPRSIRMIVQVGTRADWNVVAAAAVQAEITMIEDHGRRKIKPVINVPFPERFSDTLDDLYLGVFIRVFQDEDPSMSLWWPRLALYSPYKEGVQPPQIDLK